MQDFGDELSWRYVMGGLAREIGGEGVYPGLITDWLDLAADSGMPFDPRIWAEGPIRSTYPACMAVKAAAEQGPDAAGRYLRALREGLMCFRRKLDTPEALVEEARGAGLDVERFRLDLSSNAIVEAFGYDLEEARGHGMELPFLVFGDGEPISARASYEELLAAGGLAAPGSPSPPVPEALRRFGRMATPEVGEVCRLPGPRAGAELWRLAAEWQARRVPVLTGELWEPA